MRQRLLALMRQKLLGVLVVANLLLLLAQIIWIWRNWVNINLLLAAASGDPDMFLWIKLGANVNARTQNGATPLMLATASRSFVGMLDLIRAGASVNCRDRSGRTPLFIAAANGDFVAVRILLEHGADPNLKGPMGMTPLMIAARDGHRAVVELLLASGADPTMMDDRGFTAMRFAKGSRSCEAKKIIEVLEEHLRRRGMAK